MLDETSLKHHHQPQGISDRVALRITKFLRFFADNFFAKPSPLQRILVLVAQGVFYNFFFVLYLISPKTAHRVVGYFEEEAVTSYTQYLAEIDAGTTENIPAPQIAIDYWQLPPDARLREVIIAIRDDEAHHRDVNHHFSDQLAERDV